MSAGGLSHMNQGYANYSWLVWQLTIYAKGRWLYSPHPSVPHRLHPHIPYPYILGLTCMWMHFPNWWFLFCCTSAHRDPFSWVSNVVWDVFSFVSLHSLIGPENSRQSLSQSKVGLTWALVFSHASVASRLPVFTVTNCFNMNATMY